MVAELETLSCSLAPARYSVSDWESATSDVYQSPPTFGDSPKTIYRSTSGRTPSSTTPGDVNQAPSEPCSSAHSTSVLAPQRAAIDEADPDGIIWSLSLLWYMLFEKQLVLRVYELMRQFQGRSPWPFIRCLFNVTHASAWRCMQAVFDVAGAVAGYQDVPKAPILKAQFMEMSSVMFLDPTDDARVSRMHPFILAFLNFTPMSALGYCLDEKDIGQGNYARLAKLREEAEEDDEGGDTGPISRLSPILLTYSIRNAKDCCAALYLIRACHSILSVAFGYNGMPQSCSCYLKTLVNYVVSCQSSKGEDQVCSPHHLTLSQIMGLHQCHILYRTGILSALADLEDRIAFRHLESGASVPKGIRNLCLILIQCVQSPKFSARRAATSRHTVVFQNVQEWLFCDYCTDMGGRKPTHTRVSVEGHGHLKKKKTRRSAFSSRIPVSLHMFMSCFLLQEINTLRMIIDVGMLVWKAMFTNSTDDANLGTTGDPFSFFTAESFEINTVAYYLDAIRRTSLAGSQRPPDTFKNEIQSELYDLIPTTDRHEIDLYSETDLSWSGIDYYSSCADSVAGGSSDNELPNYNPMEFEDKMNIKSYDVSEQHPSVAGTLEMNLRPSSNQPRSRWSAFYSRSSLRFSSWVSTKQSQPPFSVLSVGPHPTLQVDYAGNEDNLTPPTISGSLFPVRHSFNESSFASLHPVSLSRPPASRSSSVLPLQHQVFNSPNSSLWRREFLRTYNLIKCRRYIGGSELWKATCANGLRDHEAVCTSLLGMRTEELRTGSALMRAVTALSHILFASASFTSLADYEYALLRHLTASLWTSLPQPSIVGCRVSHMLLRCALRAVCDGEPLQYTHPVASSSPQQDWAQIVNDLRTFITNVILPAISQCSSVPLVTVFLGPLLHCSSPAFQTQFAAQLTSIENALIELSNCADQYSPMIVNEILNALSPISCLRHFEIVRRVLLSTEDLRIIACVISSVTSDWAICRLQNPVCTACADFPVEWVNVLLVLLKRLHDLNAKLPSALAKDPPTIRFLVELVRSCALYSILETLAFGNFPPGFNTAVWWDNAPPELKPWFVLCSEVWNDTNGDATADEAFGQFCPLSACTGQCSLPENAPAVLCWSFTSWQVTYNLSQAISMAEQNPHDRFVLLFDNDWDIFSPSNVLDPGSGACHQKRLVSSSGGTASTSYKQKEGMLRELRRTCGRKYKFPWSSPKQNTMLNPFVSASPLVAKSPFLLVSLCGHISSAASSSNSATKQPSGVPVTTLELPLSVQCLHYNPGTVLNVFKLLMPQEQHSGTGIWLARDTKNALSTIERTVVKTSLHTDGSSMMVQALRCHWLLCTAILNQAIDLGEVNSIQLNVGVNGNGVVGKPVYIDDFGTLQYSPADSWAIDTKDILDIIERAPEKLMPLNKQIQPMFRGAHVLPLDDRPYDVLIYIDDDKTYLCGFSFFLKRILKVDRSQRKWAKSEVMRCLKAGYIRGEDRGRYFRRVWTRLAHGCVSNVVVVEKSHRKYTPLRFPSISRPVTLTEVSIKRISRTVNGARYLRSRIQQLSADDLRNPNILKALLGITVDVQGSWDHDTLTLSILGLTVGPFVDLPRDMVTSMLLYYLKRFQARSDVLRRIPLKTSSPQLHSLVSNLHAYIEPLPGRQARRLETNVEPHVFLYICDRSLVQLHRQHICHMDLYRHERPREDSGEVLSSETMRIEDEYFKVAELKNKRLEKEEHQVKTRVVPRSRLMSAVRLSDNVTHPRLNTDLDACDGADWFWGQEEDSALAKSSEEPVPQLLLTDADEPKSKRTSLAYSESEECMEPSCRRHTCGYITHNRKRFISSANATTERSLESKSGDPEPLESLGSRASTSDSSSFSLCSSADRIELSGRDEPIDAVRRVSSLSDLHTRTLRRVGTCDIDSAAATLRKPALTNILHLESSVSGSRTPVRRKTSTQSAPDRVCKSFVDTAYRRLHSVPRWLRKQSSNRVVGLESTSSLKATFSSIVNDYLAASFIEPLHSGSKSESFKSQIMIPRRTPPSRSRSPAMTVSASSSSWTVDRMSIDVASPSLSSISSHSSAPNLELIMPGSESPARKITRKSNNDWISDHMMPPEDELVKAPTTHENSVGMSEKLNISPLSASLSSSMYLDHSHPPRLTSDAHSHRDRTCRHTYVPECIAAMKLLEKYKDSSLLAYDSRHKTVMARLNTMTDFARPINLTNVRSAVEMTRKDPSILDSLELALRIKVFPFGLNRDCRRALTGLMAAHHKRKHKSYSPLLRSQLMHALSSVLECVCENFKLVCQA